MNSSTPGGGAFRRREFLAAVAAAPAVPALKSAGVKVIDAHNHLFHHANPNWREQDRKLIDAADRLGIDQVACSILPPERPATPESFRQCNQWLAEAMERFPGRILGYCFVNPGHTREALDEIRRSVEQRGFFGIKLYNDYVITEPVLRPVVELAIELKIPILQHAGHTNWLPQSQPRISDGGHIAELSLRYPEAMLICAHIAGGGDWEWTVKALAKSPGAFLDISGSVTDEGTVEMAVRYLGAQRVLFATDLSLTASVGRILSAQVSDEDRRRILSGNMQRILARRHA
jgi:uncharacterized protein